MKSFRPSIHSHKHNCKAARLQGYKPVRSLGTKNVSNMTATHIANRATRALRAARPTSHFKPLITMTPSPLSRLTRSTFKTLKSKGNKYQLFDGLTLNGPTQSQVSKYKALSKAVKNLGTLTASTTSTEKTVKCDKVKQRTRGQSLIRQKTIPIPVEYNTTATMTSIKMTKPPAPKKAANKPLWSKPLLAMQECKRTFLDIPRYRSRQDTFRVFKIDPKTSYNRGYTYVDVNSKGPLDQKDLKEQRGLQGVNNQLDIASTPTVENKSISPGWISEQCVSLLAVNEFMKQVGISSPICQLTKGKNKDPNENVILSVSSDVQRDTYVDSTDLTAKKVCNELILYECLKLVNFGLDQQRVKQFSIFTLDSERMTTSKLLSDPLLDIQPYYDHFQSHNNVGKTNKVDKADINGKKDTKMSLKNPITKSMIYVANPFFYNQQLNTEFNTFNATAQMFFSKLHDLPLNHRGRNGFDLIWLDYCGTWTGNAMCCPRNDVEYIFKHKILKTTSSEGSESSRDPESSQSSQETILAITLCTRSPTRESNVLTGPTTEDQEPKQVLNQSMRDIQQLAIDNGLVALFMTLRTYGTIFFMYFKVSRLDDHKNK